MVIQSSELYIKQFWEQHVASFELCHGTTSLYYNHFKEHGLNASYPAPLVDLVAKIRTLWMNHQNIKPLTAYFTWFLDRFARAQAENAIEFSFSANIAVQNEYTTGSRHGGEWLRELRSFVARGLGHGQLFSADEKLVLKEAQALIDVISELPVMKVKINPSCPASIKLFGEKSLLLPLDKFKKHIQDSCAEMETKHYLYTTILPRLNVEKAQLRDLPELVLTSAVPPEFLTLELIEDSTRKIPTPVEYPHLTWDQPIILSANEISKLQIDRYGLSNLDEYIGSRFDVQSLQDNQYCVTRRVSSEQNIDKEFRKNWRAAFKV